jgi:hypothetical protein
MHVVVHEAVRERNPLVAIGDVRVPAEEPPAIAFIVEDQLAMVAASDDVMDPALELDSWSTWHVERRLCGEKLAPGDARKVPGTFLAWR